MPTDPETPNDTAAAARAVIEAARRWYADYGQWPKMTEDDPEFELMTAVRALNACRRRAAYCGSADPHPPHTCGGVARIGPFTTKCEGIPG